MVFCGMLIRDFGKVNILKFFSTLKRFLECFCEAQSCNLFKWEKVWRRHLLCYFTLESTSNLVSDFKPLSYSLSVGEYEMCKYCKSIFHQVWANDKSIEFFSTQKICLVLERNFLGEEFKYFKRSKLSLKRFTISHQQFKFQQYFSITQNSKISMLILGAN